MTEHTESHLVQEGRILLRQTDWNVSEIAYGLGFEQLSHFQMSLKNKLDYHPWN